MNVIWSLKGSDRKVDDLQSGLFNHLRGTLFDASFPGDCLVDPYLQLYENDQVIAQKKLKLSATIPCYDTRTRRHVTYEESAEEEETITIREKSLIYKHLRRPVKNSRYGTLTFIFVFPFQAGGLRMQHEQEQREEEGKKKRLGNLRLFFHDTLFAAIALTDESYRKFSPFFQQIFAQQDFIRNSTEQIAPIIPKDVIRRHELFFGLFTKTNALINDFLTQVHGIIVNNLNYNINLEFSQFGQNILRAIYEEYKDLDDSSVVYAEVATNSEVLIDAEVVNIS